MVLKPRHIDCMILNVKEFSSAVTWSLMNLKEDLYEKEPVSKDSDTEYV